MRFTISREKLQEGLAAVAASIPAKTTLPVLANILVETTDKGIRLSGTDLDIAVSTEVAADVDAQGAITIPARKLQEIARELPPSPVKIASAGEQRITLDCGRSHFKILGLPRDEFPNLIESAEDTAEVWLSEPDRWWRNTVDLIVFGLERMLERSRDGSEPQEGASWE